MRGQIRATFLVFAATGFSWALFLGWLDVASARGHLSTGAQVALARELTTGPIEQRLAPTMQLGFRHGSFTGLLEASYYREEKGSPGFTVDRTDFVGLLLVRWGLPLWTGRWGLEVFAETGGGASLVMTTARLQNPGQNEQKAQATGLSEAIYVGGAGLNLDWGGDFFGQLGWRHRLSGATWLGDQQMAVQFGVFF